MANPPPAPYTLLWPCIAVSLSSLPQSISIPLIVLCIVHAERHLFIRCRTLHLSMGHGQIRRSSFKPHGWVHTQGLPGHYCSIRIFYHACKDGLSPSHLIQDILPAHHINPIITTLSRLLVDMHRHFPTTSVESTMLTPAITHPLASCTPCCIQSMEIIILV